jgi:hypothetical protein
MQLLFQEFFKKVYALSEGKTSLTLMIIVRLMIAILLIGGIGLMIFLFISGKYSIVLFILGLLIAGESAHYVRKTREKKAVESMPKKASEEHAKEMLKNESSKNKGLLKKNNSSKNKELLKKDKKIIKSQRKVKNEVLLDKKDVRAVRVK